MCVWGEEGVRKTLWNSYYIPIMPAELVTAWHRPCKTEAAPHLHTAANNHTRDGPRAKCLRGEETREEEKTTHTDKPALTATDGPATPLKGFRFCVGFLYSKLLAKCSVSLLPTVVKVCQTWPPGMHLSSRLSVLLSPPPLPLLSI